MRNIAQYDAMFTANDKRLIGEAVDRATAARTNVGIERDEVEAAILAEAARGTRSIFGLYKAGTRLSAR